MIMLPQIKRYEHVGNTARRKVAEALAEYVRNLCGTFADFLQIPCGIFAEPWRLLCDTFAGDKTRVSLISWRVTRSEDCEMTFPDKSWLIVDSEEGEEEERVVRGWRGSQFGQVAFKRRSRIGVGQGRNGKVPEAR